MLTKINNFHDRCEICYCRVDDHNKHDEALQPSANIVQKRRIEINNDPNEANKRELFENTTVVIDI